MLKMFNSLLFLDFNNRDMEDKFIERTRNRRKQYVSGFQFGTASISLVTSVFLFACLFLVGKEKIESAQQVLYFSIFNILVLGLSYCPSSHLYSSIKDENVSYGRLLIGNLVVGNCFTLIELGLYNLIISESIVLICTGGIQIVVNALINCFVLRLMEEVVPIQIVTIITNSILLFLLNSTHDSITKGILGSLFSLLMLIVPYVCQFFEKTLFYYREKRLSYKMKKRQVLDFYQLNFFNLKNYKERTISKTLSLLINSVNPDNSLNMSHNIQSIEELFNCYHSGEDIPSALDQYLTKVSSLNSFGFRKLEEFITKDSALVEYFKKPSSCGLFKFRNKFTNEESYMKIFLRFEIKNKGKEKINRTVTIEGLFYDDSQNYQRNENKFNAMILSKYIHDFKSPIFLMNELINRYLQSLSNSSFNNQHDNFLSVKKYTCHLTNIAKYITEMVQNINDFTKKQINFPNCNSRFESSSLEKVNIRKIIKFCVDFYNISASCSSKNSITIYSKIDDNVPSHLMCKKKALKQILMNLLSNSYKFTYQGEIVLSCQINTNKRVETDYLEIKVSDTGVGISEENIANLCKPFKFSTSKKREGSGLGLTIVNDLLSSINSQLIIKSVPSRGSDFSFNIPILPCPEGYQDDDSSSSISRIKNVDYNSGIQVVIPNNSLSGQKFSLENIQYVDAVSNQFDYTNTNHLNEIISEQEYNIDTKIYDFMFCKTEEDMRELGNTSFDDSLSRSDRSHMSMINLVSSISSSSSILKSSIKRECEVFKPIRREESKRSVSKFYSSLSIVQNLESSDRVCKKFRVMFIDDDTNCLRSVTKIVEKLGREVNYQLVVDYANDPIECLNMMYVLLKEKNKFYDLVITDENMPFIKGSEFAKFYRDVLQNNGFYKVPFITFGEMTNLDRAGNPFAGLLRKPCLKEDLKMMLKENLAL